MVIVGVRDMITYNEFMHYLSEGQVEYSDDHTWRRYYMNLHGVLRYTTCGYSYTSRYSTKLLYEGYKSYPHHFTVGFCRSKRYA